MRRTGFTLSELLVGLVVTSIVLSATAAIFIGVQRAYQAETEAKVTTENGRGALLFLERVLPLAGYGLDPRLAFDVTRTLADDNTDVRTQTFAPTQPAIVGVANTVVTDDVAFRYRDPSYLRIGRLNGGQTALTLDTPAGVSIPQGKLMMVLCRGGSDFVMVRVNSAQTASAVAINVTPQNSAPFNSNNNPCLTGTGAFSPYVYMVQEHRIRVVNLGGRPWLVSFRDLSSTPTDLTAPFDPIAPDVELFQVAFAMNRAKPSLTVGQVAPDSGGNFVYGDSIGETFFAQPGNPLTALPDYRTSYDDASRFTGTPANIRAVHLALVLRSSRLSPTPRKDLRTDDTFNYDAPTPAPDGFLRSLFHSAISTPNMMSRSNFAPALRSSTDTRDLNTWGG